MQGKMSITLTRLLPPYSSIIYSENWGMQGSTLDVKSTCISANMLKDLVGG